MYPTLLACNPIWQNHVLIITDRLQKQQKQPFMATKERCFRDLMTQVKKLHLLALTGILSNILLQMRRTKMQDTDNFLVTVGACN
jgi:uncharacterized membrane protein affecting hemolysin expression